MAETAPAYTPETKTPRMTASAFFRHGDGKAGDSPHEEPRYSPGENKEHKDGVDLRNDGEHKVHLFFLLWKQHV
jgi:hypothetical protein